MPPIFNNPESLTVQQLKAELKRKNVPMPRQNVKKDVYVQLYRKHILKGARGSGFSSDEDEPIAKPTPRSSTSRNVLRRSQIRQTYTQSTPSVRKGAYKIIFQDKLSDVEDMTDRKLRAELEKRGFPAGPIVASTRQIYERKLADLLVKELEKGESSRDTTRTQSTMVSFNDDEEDEEEDEDEEDEEEEEEEEEEEKFSDSDVDDDDNGGRGDNRLQKRTSHVETRSSYTSSTKKFSRKSHHDTKSKPTRYYCGMPLWLWWLLVLTGIVLFVYLVWLNLEQLPSNSSEISSA